MYLSGYNIHNNKVKHQNTFIYLLIVLLIGTNFLGLMPLASFVNSQAKPFILLRCLIYLFFAIKVHNSHRKYDKWLLFLWGAVILNKISSIYFRNQSITEVFFQGAFIYDFGFYYIIAYINPTIKQMEKAILYLGGCALCIYFIQYFLLPLPIVESLAMGWRSGLETKAFDIQRFSVTGEAFIFLLGFLSLYRFLITKNKTDIAIILLTFAFTILHGYRSLMLAYLIICVYLYFRVNGFHLNKSTLSIIIIIISSVILIGNTTIFDEIINQITQKSEAQSETSLMELDRVIEWNYFYEGINKPWEWLLGAGFIGKNFTDPSIFINWVDLGFIGVSFMGGILLAYCWIRILLINTLNKLYFKRKVYLTSFNYFIITSTLLLPTAINGKSIIVQCLALYLLCKYKQQELKHKRNFLINKSKKPSEKLCD